jgi:hypothetical protein
VFNVNAAAKSDRSHPSNAAFGDGKSGALYAPKRVWGHAKLDAYLVGFGWPALLG